MKNEIGDVRRSQVVTTHGPGSIIDFRAGGYGGAAISVVAAGLEEWDRSAPPPGLGNSQTVYEPRLQKQLNVEGFRLPPVAPQVAPGQFSANAGKLVGVRFPRWLQCPRCHIIQESRHWTQDGLDPALYCSACSEAAGGRNRVHAVPARFIVMCDKGHLDEFPWDWWVRHKEQCRPPGRRLKLEGSGTAGLGGLILSCLGCGASRSMEGCFASDTIQSCGGRRPWLPGNATEVCTDGRPRVAQRGASNIYFSAVESALDIPPWSDELQKKIGVRWAMLARATTEENLRVLIDAMRLSEVTGMDKDRLAAAIMDRIARLNAPERNLRWEEYQQLVQHAEPFGQNTEFEIRPSPVPGDLAAWISSITLATRLREVRALKGFTRVSPPAGPDDSRIARISLSPLQWLPAVENRGEGIFVQLRLDRVREWEGRPAVVDHVGRIRRAYEAAMLKRDRGDIVLQPVTPRLLLVHSLAHALIRQLALDCGYASASLRERLYVDTGESWDMAGLLIFTSSPDADGTLGGLVRQGEGANFAGMFAGAMASMSWCSSDPLCIEGVHGLSEPTNGAACHSCLLAAETSCEEFNKFLDRALLVGAPAHPELGFFQEYLREIDARHSSDL